MSFLSVVTTLVMKLSIMILYSPYVLSRYYHVSPQGLSHTERFAFAWGLGIFLLKYDIIEHLFHFINTIVPIPCAAKKSFWH